MCTCTYTYTHVCVRAPRSTTFARRIKGVRVCSHANPHTHDNVWAERVCALAHSHSFMSDIRVLCPCTPPQCSCACSSRALRLHTLILSSDCHQRPRPWQDSWWAPLDRQPTHARFWQHGPHRVAVQRHATAATSRGGGASNLRRIPAWPGMWPNGHGIAMIRRESRVVRRFDVLDISFILQDGFHDMCI